MLHTLLCGLWAGITIWLATGAGGAWHDWAAAVIAGMLLVFLLALPVGLVFAVLWQIGEEAALWLRYRRGP